MGKWAWVLTGDLRVQLGFAGCTQRLARLPSCSCYRHDSDRMPRMGAGSAADWDGHREGGGPGRGVHPRPLEAGCKGGSGGWAGAEGKAGRWDFSEAGGPAAWVKNLEGRSEFGLTVWGWGRNWALPRRLVAASV